MKLGIAVLALGVAYSFPACSKAEGFTPYVGGFVASDKHDKTLYANDSSYNGVSIGATYDFTENFFIRAEVAGTEHDANPNVSLGLTDGKFRVSVGGGRGQERARYTFATPFPQGFDTSKHNFQFVDLEYAGAFIRYQEFTTNFNFTSSYDTYPGGVPTTHTAAKNVTEDRSLIQVGYRVSF